MDIERIKSKLRVSANDVMHFCTSIDFKPKFFETIKTYDKNQFTTDFLAGFVVVIVAMPLAIAFAIASKVPPEKGLIAAIIGGFIIAFLGGTRVQIGGPAGSYIIVVAMILKEFNSFTAVIIATILAGVILILLGVFRLGTIVKYIPYPIIVGFSSSMALIIFSTQVGELLGLDYERDKIPSDFIGQWGTYLSHLKSINLGVFIVSVFSILIIVYTPILTSKWFNSILLKEKAAIDLKKKKALKRRLAFVNVVKRIPGSLLAIVTMTFFVIFLKNVGFEGIHTIGETFEIEAHIPDMNVPSITWVHITQLVPYSLTIALICCLESLLSASVADGVLNDKHNSNTELMAAGIANIITPIFGGIPVTGAIARTMTNINNGGRTPVAGMLSAVFLLIIYFVMMPLVRYIPMACLAAILAVVAYNMSEWRSFKAMFNNPRSDIAVLLLTFSLILILNLSIAIQISLVVASLLFMKRVAETTNISVLTGDGTDNNFIDDDEELIIPKGIEVYEINGPYFFGIANKFEEQISQLKNETFVRVIRMRKVPFVDSTGINNLRSLCQRSLNKNIEIVLSGVQKNVFEDLEKADFISLLAKENICSDINIAMHRATELLNKRIEELVEKEKNSDS